MARARGANAILALAYAASYGAIAAANNYFKLPFVSIDLGETRGLVASDLLGYGRDPQAPSYDVVNNEGNVVVPVDLRAFGYWLKMICGAATVTTGLAAAGSVAFTAQPADATTITVNASAFTFKNSPTLATHILIGSTLAETLRNLVVALNASADVNVTPATYTLDLALTTLLVTHDTIGTAGNSFTLATTVSGATVSGATLAGGSASGPKNHVFVAGSLTLPDAALEIGLPDVPTFAMNYGVMVNTLALQQQRSGHLNATLGLIGQGESPRTTSTAVGTLTEILLERFPQGSGQIYRDGFPLGEIVSGAWNFSNGLDKVEAIRSDGRISAIDPGMMSSTGNITTRFSNTVLLDLATNGTPVELRRTWSLGAGKSLTIIEHQVYLPKPKFPITGPGGISGAFDYQAAEHPTLHKTVTVILVNDVTAY